MAEKYNKYLWREIFAIEILSFVMIIISFVLVYFLIYYFKTGDKQGFIACIIALTICVGSCIAGVIHLVPYRSDIENASYVKYEGEITVEDGGYYSMSGSQPIVGFSGHKKRRFKFKRKNYLPDGKHEGYVVYSERSHVIVEWHCNECDN